MRSRGARHTAGALRLWCGGDFFPESRNGPDIVGGLKIFSVRGDRDPVKEILYLLCQNMIIATY
jgi:hypothetical protein